MKHIREWGNFLRRLKTTEISYKVCIINGTRCCRYFPVSLSVEIIAVNDKICIIASGVLLLTVQTVDHKYMYNNCIIMRIALYSK